MATGTLTHCPRGGPLSWTREVQPLGVVVTLQHPAAAGTRRRRQRAGSPRSQTSCPGTADNQDRRESSRRQGRRGRRLPGVSGEALPLTASFPVRGARSASPPPEARQHPTPTPPPPESRSTWDAGAGAGSLAGITRTPHIPVAVTKPAMGASP